MTVAVKYECSADADKTWGDLLRIFACYRNGDAQLSGFDWAERALAQSSNDWGDLGTDARLTYIAAQAALEALEEKQEVAVVLSRRKLGLQRISDVLKRFQITHEDADELIEGVKEYLHYMVSEKPESPPQLPWKVDNSEGGAWEIRQ